MADTNETTGVWVGRIALGLLAVLSLACIVTGGIFYFWVVGDYLQDDSPFVGLQMLGWILGLMAAGVVMAGFLLAGLLFRFLPWSHAPLASLILSIVSVFFVIATYLVFSDTGNGDNSIEVVLLQGACIVCLIVVALPPFLHWARAKPKPVAVDPPGAGQ